MADNAADQAVDWAITQAINLSRVEAGSVASVVSILEDLEAEIVGILEKNKVSIGKQKKLEAIQTAASKAIQKHYATVKATSQEDNAGVARVQGKAQTEAVNSILGASVMDPVLSDQQWEALADDELVFGAPSREWWDGQSASLRDKFSKQIRMGYGLGESVEELARRVRGTKANGFSDGIMATSKREAEALVRTSIQTISNAARIRTIEGMWPIAKGLRWLATLDRRTTDICKGLDKLEWRFPDLEPVGHKKQFPGPVAHWNCRSTQVPALASWEELSGKKVPVIDNATLQDAVEEKLREQGMDPAQIAQAVVRARESMNGQVPRDLTYEDWLKSKSQDFVEEVLGPGRAALWLANKLRLKDLTDQENRPLTIKALEEAILKGEIPVETEGKPFLPVPKAPKFGDTLADANQTAQLEIDSILANPKGKTLKAKAIKKLQKDEPGLSPMELLAKAEGIAAEKQAAATKASKLSKARKKIKAGKKPSPSEQAAIDSLEGPELENWLASIQDAKKVSSQDALDIAKTKVSPDGHIPHDDPEVKLALKKMNAADQKVLLDFMTAKNIRYQAKVTADLKKLISTAEGPTLDEALKQPDNKKLWEQLDEGNKEDIINFNGANLDNKLFGKKLAEWKAEGGLKAKAATEALQAAKESEAANGVAVSKAAVFDDAQFKLDDFEAQAAFPELEKIQLGGTGEEGAFKQQALDVILDTEHDGATLEEIPPSEYKGILEQVEAFAKVAQEEAFFDSIPPAPAGEPEAALDAPSIKPKPVEASQETAKTLLEALPPAKDNADAMIKNALENGAQGKGKTFLLYNDSEELVGAVNWIETEWGTIDLKFIGSKEPGGGSKLLQIVAKDAGALGKDIELESLNFESNAFYEKWGFKHQPGPSGEIDTLDPFFEMKASAAKQLAKDIEAYTAAKEGTFTPAGPATLAPSDAKTQLAEIIAEGDHAILKKIEDELGIPFDPALPLTQGEAEATVEALVDLLEEDEADTDVFVAATEEIIKAANEKQKKDLAAAKVQATAAAKPDITPSGPASKALPPVDLTTLDKIQDLPGTTGPYLAQDPVTGAKYVVKSTQKGLTQAHLKSEASADAIYRAAGINVPASAMADKKTKLAEFLEGETLADWQKGKSDQEIKAMHREIRKGFVADALLANHDVGGADFDNIFITKDGVPVRIDNGGALAFRAQGGKKEGWDDPDGEIRELETFRDAETAPVMSRINQGITQQEIDEQIISILSRREAIKSAAADLPQKDQKALERRLDWLERKLPASKKKTILGAGASEDQIPQDLSQRLNEGRRGAGTTIFAGNEEFEDQQLKVWRERDPAGQQLIKLEGDMTKQGGEKLLKILERAGVDTADKAVPNDVVRSQNSGPDDPFHNALESAAKTLKTHAKDKAYNQGTIQSLTNQGATLAQYAASGDKAKQDMAKHYQPIWEKLMDVDKDASQKAINEAVPWVDKFSYNPTKYRKKAKPKFSEGPVTFVNGWAVTRPPTMRYTVKELGEDGILQDTDNVNDIKGIPLVAMHGQVYRLKKGDVEITFQAFDPDNDKTQRNLQGTLRINVQGSDDEASVETAIQALNEIGLKGDEPSRAQKEALYLHKGVVLRGDETDTTYQSILSANIPEEDKVDRIKDWAEKKYDVTLPRDEAAWDDDYNPEGELPSNGTGQRFWRRWDYSSQDVEDMTGQMVLFHSGNVAPTLEGWIDNGGNATSTQERARTGVHIGFTGSSSGTDMDVGGGNFLYTSSTTREQALHRHAGFLFKGRNLARLDIRSDQGDSYGSWEAANSRTGDLPDMVQRTGIGISSNTGLVKNGLNLFDELEAVVVRTPAERAALITMIREKGLQKWPDGRSLEDVVRVSKS